MPKIVKTASYIKKIAWGNKKQWSNSPGEYHFEAYVDEQGRWSDLLGNKPLPPATSQFLQQNAFNGEDSYAEVQINFSSSGYEDPGVHTFRNGDPGYPPEGDDERTVTDVRIVDGPQAPPEVAQELEQHYQNEIQEVEIDTEPDYPEPDYEDFEFIR